MMSFQSTSAEKASAFFRKQFCDMFFIPGFRGADCIIDGLPIEVDDELDKLLGKEAGELQAPQLLAPR